VNQWTSPSGQTVESVTTMTEPRFTFSYNPLDKDMIRMRKMHILEPSLTFAWYEQTAKCCRQPNALVVDVGGNFGWYTLYSLALGCSVAVFEPVPAFYEVLRHGVSLNPGFGKRMALYANVVYDIPGNYSLRVPKPQSGRIRTLGMTGMAGRAGILKSDWGAKSYLHRASSVRVDDLVQRDVCMLKADVEGYEPQVLQTAQRLLTQFEVQTLQLELTKTPGSQNQTCAAIKMLEQLDALGYEFRQVNQQRVDRVAPKFGSWASSSIWEQLPSFPSARALAKLSVQASKVGLRGKGKGKGRNLTKMEMAYRTDFSTFSTNLIGTLRKENRVSPLPPWPALTC